MFSLKASGLGLRPWGLVLFSNAEGSSKRAHQQLGFRDDLLGFWTSRTDAGFQFSRFGRRLAGIVYKEFECASYIQSFQKASDLCKQIFVADGAV